MSKKSNGLKNRDLRFWRIRKENRMLPKVKLEVVERKLFKKLTADKNCFGIITEGIHPERMTSEEYDQWVSSLPTQTIKV